MSPGARRLRPAATVNLWHFATHSTRRPVRILQSELLPARKGSRQRRVLLAVAADETCWFDHLCWCDHTYRCDYLYPQSLADTC